MERNNVAILMRIPQRQNDYVPYPTALEIKERERLHIVLEIEGVDKQYTQCHVHFYQKANANVFVVGNISGRQIELCLRL